MKVLERHKLIEFLYLMMRDACPTGEIVRIIRMIDVDDTSESVYSSPELLSYSKRLADELLKEKS